MLHNWLETGKRFVLMIAFAPQLVSCLASINLAVCTCYQLLPILLLTTNLNLNLSYHCLSEYVCRMCRKCCLDSADKMDVMLES